MRCGRLPRADDTFKATTKGELDLLISIQVIQGRSMRPSDNEEISHVSHQHLLGIPRNELTSTQRAIL